MAEKQSVNWIGQQRVDIPDLRAIESGVIFDFKSLVKMLVGNTPYILRGFTIPVTGISGPATSLQLVVDSGVVWVPGDGNGSILRVDSGAPNEVLSPANAKVIGSFSPGANFVSIRFKRATDATTNDLVSIWDVDSDVEFTITAPRGLVLDYEIVIDGSTFGNNAPVAVVNVSGSNVTSILNAKQGMFRLGSGGATPDPANQHSYAVMPENSLLATSNSDPDPFGGGDWELETLKEWMDAVMTEIKLIKGSAFWYAPGSGGGSSPGDLSLSDVWFDSVGSLITGKGKFIHSQGTPGQLTWTSPLYIRSILGPLTYTIATTGSPMTLSDRSVAYIQLVRDFDFQPANTFTFTNGSPTITATLPVSGIVAGDWVKFFAHSIFTWAKVQTVVANTITLTSNYTGPNAVGKALKAQGDYTLQQALPEALPNNANVYWIAKRDDNSTGTATLIAAERASDVITFETAAPHNFVAGQTIVVAGVTPTSFNGTFDIDTIVSPTEFTVRDTGPDATASAFGTAASAAIIYLRSLGELYQGEERQISDTAVMNMLQYMGSPSETVSAPTYTEADSTEVENKYIADGQSLTTAIKVLDRIMYNNAHNKLIGGGTISNAFNANITAFTNIAFGPTGGGGISDGYFNQITVPAATTWNVTQILTRIRNFNSFVGTWTIKIVGDTGGFPDETNIIGTATHTSVIGGSFTDVIWTFGSPVALPTGNYYIGWMAADAPGIAIQSYAGPAVGFVTFNNGATWTSVAAFGMEVDIEVNESTLSFTSDMYLEKAGLDYTDNTIDVSESPITLPNDGDVAYVIPNLMPSGPPLSVTVSDLASVPHHAVIIARREGQDVIVGSHSMRLLPGQSSTLYNQMSDQNLDLLGGSSTPITTATSDPEWATRGSPLRNIELTDRTLDAIASIDKELDQFFGQLQIVPHETAPNKVRIRGVDYTMLNDSILSQEMRNLLISFDGAVINFTSGVINQADDTTPLGINFTPFTIPLSQYFWYGIGVVPAAVTVDNRINIQMIVTPAASANAVQASAPYPAIAGTKRLGAVQVQNVAGSINHVVIRQLGVGGGSGGEGDASSIYENLRNSLDNSLFALMTDIIASQREDDGIDPTSTADFDIAEGSYSFANPGDILLSIQLLDDDEFLSADEDEIPVKPINEVEVHAFWNETAIDSGATYEVSRNGGNNWQPLTMERVGATTEVWRGYHEFEHEYNVVLPVNLANTGVQVEMDSGTATAKIAQQFAIAGESNVHRVGFELRKGGTITGSYRFAIYGDSASLPDESNKLWISPWFSVADLTTVLTMTQVDLSVLTDLAAGTYHLVLETDATYKADYSAGVDFLAVGRNNTAALNNAATFNSTIWAAQTYDFAARVDTKLYDNDILVTQALDNTSSALNATTRQALSQAYVVPAGQQHLYRVAEVKINKATANVAGHYFLKVVRDDASNPGRPSTDLTDILAVSESRPFSALSVGNNTIQFEMDWLVRAGTYHLVMETSAAYKTQFTASAGVDVASMRTQSGTTPDSRRYDGTDWSNATGDGAWYHILSGISLDLRVRITASASDRLLDAFAVFYEKITATSTTEQKPVQVVWVDGDDDQTEFLIENFEVDPDLLQFFDVSTGQVYKYGAFTVSGQTVRFDAGQFLVPGTMIKLIFDQSSGSSYDDSALNSRILADQHFGSTTNDLDRSVPGRGHSHRSPDGTLYEFTAGDGGTLDIYEVT